MRRFSASLLALVPAAGGEARLNEVYVSHQGDDDREFLELVGVAGASLDGLAVAVVEGDASASGGVGVLDEAWLLDGRAIGAEGYFVLGAAGVLGVDLVLGHSNVLENGSATFYLLETTDGAALAALVGQPLDTDGDGATLLASMPSIRILDRVALADGDSGDRTFDGAPVLGPSGSDVPPGIFRGRDAPAPWCSAFLDFEDERNTLEPRTPGAPNGDCPTDLGERFCVVGRNSTGAPGRLFALGSLEVAAADLTLAASGLPPGAPGFFFFGPTRVEVAFGQGVRCIGGIPRVLEPACVADLEGRAALGLDFASPPAAGRLEPGSLWGFQLLYRDRAGGEAGFDLTDALCLAFR